MRGVLRSISCLFIPYLLAIPSPEARAQSYTISTAVGAGAPSNVQGTSTSLGNNVPSYLTADSAGNVYFVDQNSVIEWDHTTGLLAIVAGNGTPGYSGDNGPATSAQLNNPQGLAVDSNGDLYIADAANNVIRRVSGGVITTFAGNGMAGAGCPNGPATSAKLNSPAGLALDSHHHLFIADTFDFCVREVSGGTITTVAGNGVPGSGGDGSAATSAMLSDATGIAVDSSGNLYIADADNEVVREVFASTGIINTIAGILNVCCTFGGDGGPATNAQLSAPLSIAVDSNGNLFITGYADFTDANNVTTSYAVVRQVSNGTITTVVSNGGLSQGFSGDGGAATGAQLSSPQSVAVDGNGNLYIADQGNNRIREVSGGVINTIVGNGLIGDNGPASAAQLGFPAGIGLDTAGNLYIADSLSLRIRKVAAATGIITTIAGNGTPGTTIVDGSSATSVGLNSPSAVAADSNGNLYISSSLGCAILEVSGGLISTFAGNGTCGYGGDGGSPTSAEIGNSFGIVADSANHVYFSDNAETDTTTSARVREVAGGKIGTPVGNGLIGSGGDGGLATNAELNFPTGLAIDPHANLYIADTYNNNVREVSGGTIATVAGNAALGPGFSGDNHPAVSAQLNNPGGVAVDAEGNIFIADTNNSRIRMVSAATGFITTIAGTGTSGFSGDYGPATSAELDNPFDVVVNSNGSILVADSSGRIRVLTPTTGSSCTYSVPADLSSPGAGGSQSVAVMTNAFCPWTISGLPSWITLNTPSAATGPANAVLSIAANSGSSRSANITIAGVSVAVTQGSTQGALNACDINQDGVVNVLDVQLMVDEALGTRSPSNDLDGDKVAGVADIQIDSNAALHLGCSAGQ